MKTERCREWRESLGAYALGRLPDAERPGLEAHLEGCAGCRGELESLTAVAELMPLADPDRFDTAPSPPPGLADRVVATVAAERQQVGRRRRMRTGLALGGAAATVAAAVLAIFVLSGNGESAPERHVSFESLPPRMKIGATLVGHAFGTEIHVYVRGARPGTLCRVFLRDRRGNRLPAGSFRYRWGDDSKAILSSAVSLSHAAAMGIRVGDQTFTAPVDDPGPTGA